MEIAMIARKEDDGVLTVRHMEPVAREQVSDRGSVGGSPLADASAGTDPTRRADEGVEPAHVVPTGRADTWLRAIAPDDARGVGGRVWLDTVGSGLRSFMDELHSEDLPGTLEATAVESRPELLPEVRAFERRMGRLTGDVSAVIYLLDRLSGAAELSEDWLAARLQSWSEMRADLLAESAHLLTRILWEEVGGEG